MQTRMNILLADDTLLLLPHEEQNEEYERRYNILANGTVEQKKELLFDALHEVQRGYTPEKLMALTDEKIAEDFENLHRLNQFAANAVGLSGRKELELSEDEKKELLDFEKKFVTSVNAVVLGRATMISSPYYEQLHWEKLFNVSFRSSVLDAMAEDEEEMQALNDMENLSSDYVNFSILYPSKKFIEKQGIDGYDVNEVTWMTQDGVQVLKGNPQGESIPLDGVLSEKIANGNSLIAVLPNGKMKEFSSAVDESGRVNFNVKEGIQPLR